MPPKKKAAKKKSVTTITHDEDKRRHIPTAEYEAMLKDQDKDPLQVAYERRNLDRDPQLVWRGKEQQNLSDLIVQAPPLYIQEKVHPKVLIDDLLSQTETDEKEADNQFDLFADFNGMPDEAAKTEFYEHDANWTNRMILGDSLQVMSSLAEREGLRGKVQCVYLDPPYGIKFNSNFQWSTTSTQVKDGKIDQITREPEQVKAFRDTWRDGIHSYLTYLRDRLTVARDLLSETGSIFIQISDDNVHHVRELMDEVFGSEQFVSLISFRKRSMAFTAHTLPKMVDYLIWYSKDISQVKYRPIFSGKELSDDKEFAFVDDESCREGFRRLTIKERNDVRFLETHKERVFKRLDLCASGYGKTTDFPITINGKTYSPRTGVSWKTNELGIQRLFTYDRLFGLTGSIYYKIYYDDFPFQKLTNIWADTRGEVNKTYVVQTSESIITRCLLMATDPGDLVLDPTCGSGTAAYVSEKWGRRWVTIDTSRVSLALARTRIMGARYPYYLLADSAEGQLKEAELTQTTPTGKPSYGNIRQGFVLERAPHITLGSISKNAEIDVICEQFHKTLEHLRDKLNKALKENWEEWEIPRAPENGWTAQAKELHTQWCEQRIARQREIEASIAAKADFEYLCDKPYEDSKIVRVAGPFTVESISPHRVLAVDEDDKLVGEASDSNGDYNEERDFAAMILENLKTAGVQQAHKEDKITFTSLTGWPGKYVCAEGRYTESESENAPVKRAGIFIGPEFGTVSRPDLVAAAREAADAGCDALIACAFNYDAHSTEFDKLGSIPVLKARMNADLHMADDLKNTGKGNLFVIFGEPDIDITETDDDQIQVKINGVDVFHPQTGEVRSDGAEGIACWFIDTDYNEESFFVRHAYFLGANDPYKSLKTTLKAEINEDAWSTLNSDTSRPFDKPASGRIAIKVINHLGDEVMKVFPIK